MQPDSLRGKVLPIVLPIFAYGVSESWSIAIFSLRARWQSQHLLTREHQANGWPVPPFNYVGKLWTQALQSPHLREGSCPRPQVGAAQWVRVCNRFLELFWVAQYESSLSNRRPVKVRCLRIGGSSK